MTIGHKQDDIMIGVAWLIEEGYLSEARGVMVEPRRTDRWSPAA